MKQAVRNYIKKSNPDQKRSMMNFATIDSIPFIDYITQVLSKFENKKYQYQLLKVTEEKILMTREINVCVIYNETAIEKHHLLYINTENLLKYVSSTIKDSKDFMYFEVKSNKMPILDEQLEVNLTSFLTLKFPYLKDIVYDLLSHKYEHAVDDKDINYQELLFNLDINYKEEIKNRQKFLLEEKSKLTKEEAKKERELNHIIDFIQNTELDEGTKKILIYSVDKHKGLKY